MRMRSCVAAAAISFGLANAVAEDWWRVFGEIKKGPFSGGSGRSTGPLTPAQREFLDTSRFAEWVDYEDEFVRLKYPKHPELKFETVEGDGKIEVKDGGCVSVDDTFSRTYTLRAGSQNYCTFTLRPAGSFDDAIDPVSPTIHKVYRVEDKNLIQFSLLPGGAVEKAQVLGDKLRLASLGWTHLTCPRAIYEQMVEQMELKIALGIDQTEGFKRVSKKYGLDGKSGFVHRAMGLDKMKKLLGEPAEVDEFKVIWRQIRGDYHCELGAIVRDGRLQRFWTDGFENRKPVEGTLAWVAAEIRTKTGSVSAEELSAALLKLARDLPGEDWDEWCQTATEFVATANLTVEDLREAVRLRSKGTHFELHFFVATGWSGTQDWARTWLERILVEKEPEGEPERDALGRPFDRRAYDAQAMLNWLWQRNERAARKQILAFSKSDRLGFQQILAEIVANLDPSTAQQVIVRGLEVLGEGDDTGLAEALFQGILDCKLTDREKVRELVERLPEKPAESSWSKLRKKAVQTLSD